MESFVDRTDFSPIIFRFMTKIKIYGPRMVHYRGAALKQKIKQDRDGNIGKNIREIRIARGIGQTELVRMLDLQGIPITRECLVKIERGIQHVQVQQTYDELLK